MNDRSELSKDIHVRLRRIRVFPHGDLERRQPDRPHIRRDGVGAERVLRLAPDAFWCHVALTSNIRLGERFFELTGYSKITEFDIAFLVKKNIRGFDI
jgi:hypothetical protein